MNRKVADVINVIASICVKAGTLSEFLEIFKGNVSNVKGEKGCIEYFPSVDIDAAVPKQRFDENAVTVIEKWDSLEAFRDHQDGPVLQAYKKRVENIVEDVSLKVLQEV